VATALRLDPSLMRCCFRGRPRHSACLRNVSRAIFAGAIILLTCGLTPARGASPVLWDSVADGLRITLWTPPSLCHDVSPLIAVEIDPDRYRFAVHYYRNEKRNQPLDIHEWRVMTGHDLVFNAGLFRENFAYLGLLYGNGQSLGGKRHATWLGLFAAEPTASGGAAARILDLSIDSFDELQPPYREAAQSLMLLDQTGTIRVRRSGKQAHQTIVGEQATGQIVLFKTTQPASLYDLGHCLHEAFPTLRRTMAMDGGSSSDIALAPSLRTGRIKTGDDRAWMPFLHEDTVGHIGLPAVIGISPRKDKPSPSIHQEQLGRRHQNNQDSRQ
jgi:uncharacterized protein YigE (DUF2233 family)